MYVKGLCFFVSLFPMPAECASLMKGKSDGSAPKILTAHASVRTLSVPAIMVWALITSLRFPPDGPWAVRILVASMIVRVGLMTRFRSTIFLLKSLCILPLFPPRMPIIFLKPIVRPARLWCFNIGIFMYLSASRAGL